MQKPLSAYNQPFNTSSSSSSPSTSPSSTTINQLANMFQLGNSLTTTTTTTTTSKTDSENRVIFADPCSKCGTKKRRVSPIHQNQDFFFSPRKKLLIQSPPSPSTTTISPFQNNSASHQQPILSSPSSDSANFLRRCNSLPSSIENNRNNAIAPKSPVSFIKLDSFAKSPEDRPSISQPASYLGQLGSFSASSGCTAEGSPISASRPPRPPKLSRSISDPLPTSSPGTKILSLPDQKGWTIFKDCLAAMNQFVNGSTQKEEAEDHKDDNENKQVSVSNGEENAETEGNPVGMFKCSCGKRCMQIFVKTLMRTITLMVRCSDTVAYVKRKIEEMEGIPEVYQILLFSGKELVEGQTIGDHNIRDFTTLQLELRLRGGSPFCKYCPKKFFETEGEVLRHLENHKKVDENKEMEAQKKQKDWKKKSVKNGKAPGEKKKEGEMKKKTKKNGKAPGEKKKEGEKKRKTK